jgi:hypothetical protein
MVPPHTLFLLQLLNISRSLLRTIMAGHNGNNMCHLLNTKVFSRMAHLLGHIITLVST